MSVSRSSGSSSINVQDTDAFSFHYFVRFEIFIISGDSLQKKFQAIFLLIGFIGSVEFLVLSARVEMSRGLLARILGYISVKQYVLHERIIVN